jgi:hypothetical protein
MWERKIRRRKISDKENVKAESGTGASYFPLPHFPVA